MAGYPTTYRTGRWAVHRHPGASFELELRSCYRGVLPFLDMDALTSAQRFIDRVTAEPVPAEPRTPAQRVAYREKRHRLEPGTIEAARAEQGDRCKICQERDELVVDHDHKHCQGQFGCRVCFRGLICNSCNRALGFLRDNPRVAMRMARYLRGTL